MFSNFEFLVFVSSLVANLSIFVIVFRYALKDQSRILFLSFVLAQTLWITINYFSFSAADTPYFLSVTRLTLYFAAFHALTFYLFVSNFLQQPIFYKKRSVIILAVVSLLVAALTLSPVFFSSLGEKVNGIQSPNIGPLIGLFGAFVGYRNATGIAKSQWRALAIGLVSTFLLVGVFSFISFAVFGNPAPVKYGHLYTLPFVVLTAYAIVKHRLLNLKAVLAEIMIIVLVAIIFIQFINSASVSQFIASGIALLGTLAVGVALVRGVEKEVKQREELQILTKKLEEANEQLKALDKARSDFITIASHQLRTPPATIKWYLGSILSGDYGNLDQGVKTELEKAQVTNNSLISLIDDMLNASRIERGKMEFLFEEVDLEQLTKLTYDQMVPLAGMKKLGLTYQPPTSPIPHVMADREKIRQVVNNFIDNAIKYTKSGSVSVAVIVKNEAVEVRVTDTGKGLSETEQKNLFSKYTRGKDAMTHSSGLGLGLYVAKIIVEQHKGKIWAESPGEGKGSTFAFSIPLHADLPENSVLNLALPNNPQK